MTQAVPDLVGMSEEVAAWPLPIDFLFFWLGVGDDLLPVSTSMPRRRLKNYGWYTILYNVGTVSMWFYSSNY
jgi:hypothetical protein